MIPLLILALALSAGLATYEFSPSSHTWVDDHVRAIRGALAAHHAADTHLSAARGAAHPAIAVQHARAASTANREAAQQTAIMAKTARTEPQRAAAVQSAVTVDVREDEITDTLVDANLGAAEVATDPVTVVEHVHEATVANQASAQKGAEAAAAAKTEQQRTAAAQSAAKIIDRANKIAAAWTNFGAGQCEVRLYAHVTPQIKDVLLAKLHGEGMAVTGDNPWTIDTHQHGVKLRAVWNSATQTLKLIVTAGAGGLLLGEPVDLVCPAVWAKLDPILKKIIGT